jgi:hypothetical protein
MLDILDKDIIDIVQCHGRMPADPVVFAKYRSKLQERDKIQKRLMQNRKKNKSSHSQQPKTPPLTHPFPFPAPSTGMVLYNAQPESANAPAAAPTPNPRNNYNWHTVHGAWRVQLIADAVLHTNNEKGEVTHLSIWAVHFPHITLHLF